MKKLIMLCGLLAAVAFAPAAKAEDLKLPEGQAAVHYFRPDGAYEGWGLHVWESFQPKEDAGDEFALKEMSDRPLPGVSWFKPFQQSGKDDFGVYFLLPTKEFGNGRVNYILHKGDKKDQCNKDMFFLIKDSREIYVNASDCNIYTSKDAAVKARK